jgi:hypothetical protein
MKFCKYIVIGLALLANLSPRASAVSGDPTIDIQLGESGNSFASRNAKLLKVDRQPAGLNFHQIRFPTASRGQARIRSGVHTFTIAKVLSITGIEDLDYKDEGMQQFNINSALTDANLISHDEARLKFFSILQAIVRSGWRSIIPLSMARLRGKQLTQYFLISKHYTTLDPSYIPTLDEWMRMMSLTSWEFFAANTYMNVSFMREYTLTDPSKPGAYLISFEIQNEAERFRRHIDGSDRKRWKEAVPTALRELAASRAKMEAELRLKGMTIDDKYIDPPVPAEVVR